MMATSQPFIFNGTATKIDGIANIPLPSTSVPPSEENKFAGLNINFYDQPILRTFREKQDKQYHPYDYYDPLADLKPDGDGDSDFSYFHAQTKTAQLVSHCNKTSNVYGFMVYDSIYSAVVCYFNTASIIACKPLYRDIIQSEAFQNHMFQEFALHLIQHWYIAQTAAIHGLLITPLVDWLQKLSGQVSTLDITKGLRRIHTNRDRDQYDQDGDVNMDNADEEQRRANENANNPKELFIDQNGRLINKSFFGKLKQRIVTEEIDVDPQVDTANYIRNQMALVVMVFKVPTNDYTMFFSGINMLVQITCPLLPFTSSNFASVGVVAEPNNVTLPAILPPGDDDDDNGENENENENGDNSCPNDDLNFLDSEEDENEEEEEYGTHLQQQPKRSILTADDGQIPSTSGTSSVSHTSGPLASPNITEDEESVDSSIGGGDDPITKKSRKNDDKSKKNEKGKKKEKSKKKKKVTFAPNVIQDVRNLRRIQTFDNRSFTIDEDSLRSFSQTHQAEEKAIQQLLSQLNQLQLNRHQNVATNQNSNYPIYWWLNDSPTELYMKEFIIEIRNIIRNSFYRVDDDKGNNGFKYRINLHSTVTDADLIFALFGSNMKLIDNAINFNNNTFFSDPQNGYFYSDGQPKEELVKKINSIITDQLKNDQISSGTVRLLGNLLLFRLNKLVSFKVKNIESVKELFK